jgi:hypothetical protein
VTSLEVGDNGSGGSPLSTCCCILLQPLVVYVSKSMMLVAGTDASRMAGQLYGNIRKGEAKQLEGDVETLGPWACSSVQATSL